MWSFASLWCAPSHAYIYVGNPDLTVRVSRPSADLTASTGHLDFVREHLCGGGSVDVPVDQTVDLLAGVTISVPGGDLCGVSLHWSSDVTTSKSGAWSVVYAEDHTSVDLSTSPDGWAALTPFTVTSGTFQGDPPRVLASLAD